YRRAPVQRSRRTSSTHIFFFSSRRRHTRSLRDWSSDVCSSDLVTEIRAEVETQVEALFGYTLWLDYPNQKRLAAWRRRAQVAAAAKAGYGHTAYGLLKVEGAIDRTARLLYTVGEHHGPERLHEIREALAAAVQSRGA